MPASSPPLRLFASVVLLVLSGLLLLLPASARADSSRWLPGQPGFGDIVVDEANGHVFISPGKSGSRLRVHDLDGNPLTTIAPIPGGTGMVLDGTTLYVALCEQSAISVISTTTLTEIERIPLGTVEMSGTCDLALAAGRLWFPTSDQWANVGSVTTSPAHTVVANAFPSTLSDPMFMTNSATATHISLFESNISSGPVRTYDVTTTPPTLVGTVNQNAFIRDGALSADGGSLVTAFGTGGTRLNVPAMTPAGTYNSTSSARSAALTSDGAWVAIGRTGTGRDIYVFPVGSPVAAKEFELGTGLSAVAGGTRFSANGSRIYAVGATSTGQYALNVLLSPTTGVLQPPAPTITPAPTTAPAPGSSASFPLSGIPNRPTDLVVDAANNRVFIAPGPTGNGILVRHLDGSAAGTIPDEPGATSMVLSGGFLYVTLCGWNAIDVIDATTLVRTERIDLGANTIGGNCSLGIANGRLFYPDSDQWVRVRNVSVASPHVFGTHVLGVLRYAPRFATSSSNPNRLIVAETGISSTMVEAYDVTASTVTRSSFRSISGFGNDVAADVQGSSATTLMRDLRTSDMSIAATYSGTGATAFSPDGSWVASLGWQSTAPDVAIFARGDNEPRRKFEIVAGSGEAYGPTLAFSPSGDRLYAIVSPTFSPTAPTLHVIDAPTASRPVHADFTAAPTLSGSQAQGSQLTCGTGTWSGSPSFTYTWHRDATLISGATASTYTTTATDAAREVRCMVQATTGAGSVNAVSNAIVVTTPPVNTALPAIGGTDAPGATLTCAPGSWSGSPSFAYQWRRDGAPIALATTATLVVDPSLFGSTITCAVTATESDGAATASSASVVIGGPPLNTVPPVLSGTASIGAVLLCGSGSWTGDPSFTYAWSRSGVPISEASAATYTVVAGDAGAVIGCIVSATNAYGANSATSAGSTVTLDDPPTDPSPIDPDPGPNPNPAPDPATDPDEDEELERELEEAEPDTTKPKVTVTASRHRLAAALRSGVRVKVACDERCSVSYRVELHPRTAKKLRLPRVVASGPNSMLAADRSRTMTLRFTKLARQRLAPRAPVAVTVRIVASDAAGNSTVRLFPMTLTR